MGNCIGLRRNNNVTSQDESEDPSSLTVSRESRSSIGVGKNLALRHEKYRWKSDLPLTEKQVKCKREEFWDTAPAFEGRREIWDALKAAASALESSDFTLAQAIIDGASITLPHGSLTDCYDELGTRYQVPVYCFSMPVNVLIPGERSTSAATEIIEDDTAGEEIILRIRLSTTSKDIKLPTRSTFTIKASKVKLMQVESLGDVRQRWYYGGKLIPDKMRVVDCSIPPTHIIQCIINERDA